MSADSSDSVSISLAGRLVRYFNYRKTRFALDRTRPLRRRRIAALDRAAHEYFQATELRRRIVDVMPRSASTGAEWPDYHLLHQYIQVRRPSRIIEFGSGVTTLVMAGAMAEAAAADRAYDPRLFTLEDVPRFHENVKALVPDDLASRVTFLCSPRRETAWHESIWGFCYTQLPSGRFDFVFVDGPTEYRDADAKRQGIKGANLDLLFLLERDPGATADVVVDRRLNSLEAYQSVLPAGLVRYDPIQDVGVLPGVSGHLLDARRTNRLQYGHARALLRLPR